MLPGENTVAENFNLKNKKILQNALFPNKINPNKASYTALNAHTHISIWSSD